jgi:hypothetical protein
MALVIRCSQCGRDAPGDSDACPHCGYAGGPPRVDRAMLRPWLYGAIAAAVEIALVVALVRC